MIHGDEWFADFVKLSRFGPVMDKAVTDAVINEQIDRALERRKATRILHEVAAQARISAEWARRADEARAYRARLEGQA